jgi:predicted ABC-type transport system involved in lysophospholipase L1 biosynthesis ATPase subunit
VALLAGVLAATTGFTVLTGTTATARLEVTGTVDANARAAYDILVRPKGARTSLESDPGLVRPNYLSGQFGGQQQRVAIARALMGDPGLLLADEPTGNLDSTNGGQILDLLLDLRERRGMTILLATHEQHIAARCDRLVRLTDGRLVEDLDLTDGEDPATTLARATRLRL